MLTARFLYCIIAASAVIAAPAASSVPLSAASAPPSPQSASLAVSSALPSTTGTEVVSSSVSSAPPEASTVAPASDALNDPVWSQDTTAQVEAINGQIGATIIAPDNTELDQQNPDLFAPPTTDSGAVANAKWPFALSHNRLQAGGWARQQNVNVMPIATTMASVNMRLEAGAVRELHWHSTAEWAYVLKGNTRVTAVNTDGQVFVDTVGPGDLWYFPAGIPHSLQGTDDDPDGTEFLLVFDDGAFSEDSTFQLTDWTAHIPKEVLAKNFQVNASAFDHIPSKELYIFPAAPPTNAPTPQSPNGNVPNPFTFKMSQMAATPLSGGSIKVADSRNFAVSQKIVGALVTVEPGAMRELHWHPTQAEWSYFLGGEGRITLFASAGTANTFDYRVGDIGYVPPSFGHYVENTGNTTMTYLEIFNSDLVQDLSLNQWLALTPPELVKAHLGVDDSFISQLNKTKQTVVGPS